MKHFLIALLAVSLIGCSSPVAKKQDWSVTGAPEIADQLKRVMNTPLTKDKKPLYHIHLEEKVSLEKLNPLNFKTLHTAYQLTDRVTLTWDPVPKDRTKITSFEQSTLLDIASTTSIQTTPQVRHAKHRLQKYIVGDIVSYLR